jgi:pyruvate/2-oxoglutarate dehydrogenase complex dihydrolipoamide dehydrogenase (E3) component
MYAGAEFDREWRSLVFPENYANPTPPSDGRYNLVVIGAGPAGLIVSIAAAGLGARVALIERHAMGGDCLNVGCVPSKSLIEMARRRNAGADVSFADSMAWVREVRAGISHHDSVARYSDAGVDVYLGDATFVDGNTVEVAGTRLAGRNVVICTGARAALPPIDGLADIDALTNESVFELTEQPRRLAVLGAGPIGCELAQSFARIGTEVHLFEMADAPLPLEIPEAGALVAAQLRADGVHTHFGTAVQSVRRDGDSRYIAGAGDEIEVDQVLVALGRRPNVDGLGLEAAGVEYDARKGITVDNRLRTSNPAVYAAGDVCSKYQFTNNADHQARIIVRNTLFFGRASPDANRIARCTYTHPEVAHVGAEQRELDEQGVNYDTYEVPWGELDRARTEGATTGFARVLTEAGGDRILSATLVGDDAGEQIATLAVLLAMGRGLGDLDGAVLPYPTRSEYLRRLVDQYNRTRLTPFVAGLFRRILAWRR